MKLIKDLLLEQQSVLPTITLQQAYDDKLFGPVYHGTDEEGHKSIMSKGFTVVDDESDIARANGYPLSNYAMGIPAPLHHLGFGAYFTTSKTIGKKFNRGTTKGLREYFLDVPRLETINFAAESTMMKWWIANGYDFNWDNVKERDFRLAGPERLRATKNLTKVLSQRYDAVWFKGKTLRSVLDGDQICVYRPQGRVYSIDNSTITGLALGAKVRLKNFDTVYKLTLERIQVFRPEFTELVVTEDSNFHILNNSVRIPKDPRNTGIIVDQHGDAERVQYSVKWKRGGTQTYFATVLDPLT